MQIGRKHEIDWDAFIHAILSGVGSAICVYLNVYAAVHMTGISGTFQISLLYTTELCERLTFPFTSLESIGSLQECNGPLTSLHRIVPALTQGM